MDHSHTQDQAEEPASLPLDKGSLRILLDNRTAFKSFLRRKVPSDETAEDLLQQGLLKAIRHSGELSDKENVTAWFYRILRNTLTDFYRARAAEGRRQEGLQRDLETSGEAHSGAADEEIMAEVCACMGRLLPTLKAGYGELIRRIDLGGEEPAAVAESAGITYNNLMVRLHRARQALKKSLENSCGVCTTHGCLDCTCGHGGGEGGRHGESHDQP
jgi:RNA polymerase sigma-70 factor (ECF subfamily)